MTTLHPLIAKMTPEEFGRHIFRWGMQSFPLGDKKLKIEIDKAVSQVVERQKLCELANQATITSLRAEVERLMEVKIISIKDSSGGTYEHTAEVVSLKSQLSRLKEILKGRDEALEKIRDLNILEARKSIGEQRPFEVLTKIMSVCDEALSKTWEEGEK